MTTSEEIREAQDHSAWGILDRLIKEASSTKPRSGTDRETISRLLAVAQYVRRYRSSDFRLMPRGPLSNLAFIANEAQLISDLLEGWDQRGGMTPSTTQSINQYLDGLLEDVSGWPALPSTERERAAEDSERSDRAVISTAIDTLLADVVHAQEQLAKVEQLLQSVESKTLGLTSEASDALQQLSIALEENADAAKQQRQADHEQAEAVAKKQRAAITAKANESINLLSDEAQIVVNDIKKHEATASKLLAFVSDGTVSGGYGKYAQAELNAYRLWNTLGAATALAGVAYLIWHFSDISNLDASVTITRAALSLPLFGFTAFAFRQATIRHRHSVDAKYRALDLLALPPFTNDMPEADRSQLRMIMGQRIFSRLPEGDAKATDAEPVVTQESISTLTSLLQALQKFAR